MTTAKRWEIARKLFAEFGKGTKLGVQDFFNDPKKATRIAKISKAAQKRWKDAREITNLLELEGKPAKIFDVYKNITKYRKKSSKIKSEVEKIAKKRNKTLKKDQQGRPYFTYDKDEVKFWKEEKIVHEAELDTTGFHFRYIDLYRWQKWILPELKKRLRNKDPSLMNVYAVMTIKADNMLDNEYFENVQFGKDGEAILTFFAGDLNPFDEVHLKLLDKARKGSDKYNEIVTAWLEFYRGMIQELEDLLMNESLLLTDATFEGFAVNVFDVGQDEVRY